MCRAKGIEVVFGRGVEGIREVRDWVELRFGDGEVVNATVLLGCDGIHSATRKLLVEPDRKPKYTGVAVAMSCINLRTHTRIPWQTTALITSRRRSFMASYFDSSKKQQYIAAVMETEEVGDKEGWRVKGAAQETIKKDIQERFHSPAMPEIGEMITDAQEWNLYPVYALPPRGKWISPGKKCILLGDAVHAMPPQGESTGICIEDSIAFAHMFNTHLPDGLERVFDAYEQLRREPVEAAYQTAALRWENVKDCGWLTYKMRVWMTPWFLWWTANAREAEFAEDLVRSLKSD
ncbi:Salicylate hydroxylase [Acrodontium crateriforme]|uniref:Salicylate hydroxylase n=1 Tax=Acrodontium crateriforme TaxID=150365 RepID=A0AAQ3RBJ7_9PEZI|nr:Salicylate hydroxylase [Acrodontium crateriforme]